MKKLNKILLLKGFILLVLLPSIFALKDLLVLQGSAKNSDGTPVDDGNLTILIYEAATGGNPAYNSTTDYVNQIQNGEFSINVGNGTNELDLIFNGIYYLDMEINDVDLDFRGQERQLFQSTIGNVTNLSNVLYVSGGNVGVGTASPAEELNIEVSSTGTPAEILLEGDTTATGEEQGAIVFKDRDTANFAARIAALRHVGGTDTAGITFETRNAGGLSERMRIDRDGNVGIGTTSPATKLHVNSSGQTDIRSESNASSNVGFSMVNADRSWSILNNVGLLGGQGVFNIYDASAAQHRFVIDESGNVGIGTTGPAQALDVEVDSASNWVATFFNDGNNVNREGIMTSSGADDAAGTNVAMTIRDGDGTTQGEITFSSGTVTYGAFTANHDVSVPEDYNEQGYEYGTLMCIIYTGSDPEGPRKVIYNVEACTKANSKNVLGAYAGKYDDENNLHQVYILGDGHILVSSEGGNIRIGDPITTSSEEGIGKKANDAGLVIGIAQENYDFTGSENKLIAVQYGVHNYVPQNLIDQLKSENEALKKRIEALEANT